MSLQKKVRHSLYQFSPRKLHAIGTTGDRRDGINKQCITNNDRRVDPGWSSKGGILAIAQHAPFESLLSSPNPPDSCYAGRLSSALIQEDVQVILMFAVRYPS
jgi:hypothetical protein